ncbi:MAG: FGGY family carbohydrate kinase, partial [Chloroflexota bacterium]|nr:FGGY family carbohydrate kinase [Chloroflexota bacterium]
MDDLLLGLDIGTSGSKALLLDAAGRTVATATAEYGLATPRPLWAEQDPADWWTACVTVIRQVLAAPGVQPAAVRGVGLSGQMHGLVLLDKAGAVLRPCILWNDGRSGPQCAAITAQLGLPRLLAWIANPVLPGFTAPKLLWVREHEPAVYARVAQVLLPKDYVRFCLTGEYATEVSDASGTALLDVQHRRWSAAMLDALGIPAAWLPPVYESPAVSARVSAAAAAATGLPVGLP